MFGNLFNNKSNLNLLIFSIFLLVFDQVSKAMIVSQFDLYESIPVAPFFNLTFVVNYGFAFGFLNSPSLNQIIVVNTLLIIANLKSITVKALLYNLFIDLYVYTDKSRGRYPVCFDLINIINI